MACPWWGTSWDSLCRMGGYLLIWSSRRRRWRLLFFGVLAGAAAMVVAGVVALIADTWPRAVLFGLACMLLLISAIVGFYLDFRHVDDRVAHGAGWARTIQICCVVFAVAHVVLAVLPEGR